jgi:histidyl-tRNA synthetase
LKDQQEPVQPEPVVFVATLGKEAEIEGFRIVETLRARGIWAEQSYGAGSLKSQLRRADRIGAAFALIIGENELKAGLLQWKNMKKDEQGEVAVADVVSFFQTN